MDESSQHVGDNNTEDPGVVAAEAPEKSNPEENECEVTSSAIETEPNSEKW